MPKFEAAFPPMKGLQCRAKMPFSPEVEKVAMGPSSVWEHRKEKASSSSSSSPSFLRLYYVLGWMLHSHSAQIHPTHPSAIFISLKHPPLTGGDGDDARCISSFCALLCGTHDLDPSLWGRGRGEERGGEGRGKGDIGKKMATLLFPHFSSGTNKRGGGRDRVARVGQFCSHFGTFRPIILDLVGCEISQNSSF